MIAWLPSDLKVDGAPLWWTGERGGVFVGRITHPGDCMYRVYGPPVYHEMPQATHTAPTLDEAKAWAGEHL